MLLALLLAAGLAVGAIVTLGHGRSETPAASAPSASLRELVQTLGVLRHPQTASDRRSLQPTIARGGMLPAAFDFSRTRVCKADTSVILLCSVRLDRRLVRAVRLGRSGYRVSIFPAVGVKRAQASVLLTFRGPGVYFTESESGPTDLPVLRSQGVLVSAYAAPGIDRDALLVPDGVSKVALDHFRLLAPKRARLPHLAATISPVRDNVAFLQLGGVTEHTLHLDPRSLGRYFTQGSGRDCTITFAVYALPATARMTWVNADGVATHRVTVHLRLYLGTHHPVATTLPGLLREQQMCRERHPRAATSGRRGQP